MSALASALGSWDQVCNCYLCNVEFASPIIPIRRKDGREFYCPNGHRQFYTETDAIRLRKQLEAKEAEVKRVRESLDWERSQRETSEKRRIAQKAQTTKARNQLKRVKNGVCPCCNRTFQNLMRHMDTQHPGFTK